MTVSGVNGKVAGFVAACDRALELRRELLHLYETNGDYRASQVQIAIDVVEARRAQALDGSLPRPTSEIPRLGLSPGMGEFDLHPEDSGFADSVYDIEDYSSREMGG